MSNYVPKPETVALWNTSTFMWADNRNAVDASDDTLRWYQSYEQDFEKQGDTAPKAKRALADYKSSLRRLEAVYSEHKSDRVLDPMERLDLLNRSGRTFTNLNKLIANADRLEESSKPQVRSASKPAVQSETKSKASATPSSASKSATEFNGRYDSAADDALEQVARGTTSLEIGAKGAAVKEAQELMLAHGADLGDYGADGMLGPVTREAVVALQKKFGIKETGTLNAKTLDALRKSPSSAQSSVSPHPMRGPILTGVGGYGVATARRLEGRSVSADPERAAIQKRIDGLGSSNPRLARELRRQIAKIDRGHSPEGLAEKKKALTAEREEVAQKLGSIPASGRNARSLRRKLEAIDLQLADVRSKIADKPEPVVLLSV